MHKLKELRIKKGFSQKQLGEVLDITQQGYSKIELGLRKLNHDQVIKLSLFLDVTPDILLDFEEAYKKYTDYLISLKEDEDIEQ